MPSSLVMQYAHEREMKSLPGLEGPTNGSFQLSCELTHGNVAPIIGREFPKTAGGEISTSLSQARSPDWNQPAVHLKADQPGNETGMLL